MDAFISSGGLPEYYRCEVNNKTEEEWYSEGTVSAKKGALFIIIGLVCQVAYIPCLIVMTQKTIWQLPVYKILFLVTILDMISILSDFILAGYYFVVGAVYCTNPVFNYIWGCVANIGWIGCCIGCFFLVVTRFVDLMSTQIHDSMFGGRRIWFSAALGFAYISFHVFYTRPPVFNTRLETWMWDPMIWPDGRDWKHFTSPYFVVNNLGVVMITVLLTLGFSVIFAYKMRKQYNFRMDKKQVQLLLQSLIISLCSIFTAVCYVYIQFVDANPFVVTMALTAWQSSNVCGLFVFYVMNRTIRRKVLSLLRLGLRKPKISTIPGAMPTITQ